jgi:hypothetical protein
VIAQNGGNTALSLLRGGVELREEELSEGGDEHSTTVASPTAVRHDIILLPFG